jgi:hypothetical protein
MHLSVNNATDFLKILERSLSKRRLDGYRMQGGTERDAFAKCLWNTQLCECLYPGFQILEVAFRNSVHAEIASALGDNAWLSGRHGFLYDGELEAIQKSMDAITLKGRRLTEDILIAEMKFGFWTSLLDSRYDLLWHKIITGVFPHMPKTIRTRREASKMMNAVRHLRNSALHHHSIWHWGDLERQHAAMRLLIAYICKVSDEIANQIDRFQAVYALGLEGCKKTTDKIFTALTQHSN